MPVQKTESRLPDGATAADLGEVATTTNGNLISYLSSPVVAERIQNYVVFPSGSISANVNSYRWTINNNGTVTTQNTSSGTLEFTPNQQGNLSISVDLLNSANTAIATLQLTQNVIVLNPALEQLIDQQDTNIPAAAHPATSREVINDLRAYIDGLASPTTETLLNKLILSLAYAAILQTPQVQRNNLLQVYAGVLNNNQHANFLQRTQNGIGVCRVRPQLLAMFLTKSGGGTYIPFTDLPAGSAARRTAQQNIETAFNALSEDDKIDVFNRLRFPKSNVAMCKLILDGLKDHYFNTQTYQAILSDATKAKQLATHFDNGPWQ